MKNLFSKLALVLFAVVLVPGLSACGGSPTGPDDSYPTPTPTSNPARISINIEFMDSNDNVVPATGGIVHMKANQPGRVRTTVLAPQVPDRMFEGTVTYWPSVSPDTFPLTRNTNVPDTGMSIWTGFTSAPKGSYQVIAKFTEKGGDISTPEQQTIAVQVQFD